MAIVCPIWTIVPIGVLCGGEQLLPSTRGEDPQAIAGAGNIGGQLDHAAGRGAVERFEHIEHGDQGAGAVADF
jgi:hypothetical protein